MNEKETGNAAVIIPEGENSGLLIPEELNPSDIARRVEKIQLVLKEIMKAGIHYGTIEGCGDKMVLLKPGAEILGLLFRLAPTYEIKTEDLPGGHKDFRVICSLTHIPTGNFMGQGLGSCSTMESKYRFRTQSTGRAVPGEYWKDRDPSILGGPQFAAKKIKKKDGNFKWEIIERIEYEYPVDYYNTCLKIAKKRSHNDVILTATGASDIFAPDPDDLPPPPEQPGKPPTVSTGARAARGKAKAREEAAINRKINERMSSEGLSNSECSMMFEWAYSGEEPLTPAELLENFPLYFNAWELERNPATDPGAQEEDLKP